ncbi:MAG: hypothetical protein J6S85_04675 [Methanobrevibacter sp.]|nr:hypothetical protein [Methanobrevibacter sp.]
MYNKLKWILDFESIEKIQKEGKANITAKELLRMARESKNTNDEIIKDMVDGTIKSNGKFTKEMFEKLLNNANDYNIELINMINYLESLNPEIYFTFERGC